MGSVVFGGSGPFFSGGASKGNHRENRSPFEEARPDCPPAPGLGQIPAPIGGIQQDGTPLYYKDLGEGDIGK